MKERPLYIWGVEPAAVSLGDFVLERFGTGVVGFVDWSEQRVGEELSGLPIVSPVSLKEAKNAESPCYVLVGVRAWRNIGCVLINMGFSHLTDFAVPLCDFQSESSFYAGERFDNLLFVGQRTSNFARLSSGLVSYRIDGSPVRKIGAFCSVAEGATMVQNHPMYASTSSYFLNTDVKLFEEHFSGCNAVTEIGNDVWLGRNAIIMPGVKIGNGAVIGSSCVVTKDVPDYAIVMGNPGRMVGFRFSSSEIELLNAAQWWNWPLAKIEKNKKLFQTEDLSPFFETLKEMLDRRECF